MTEAEWLSIENERAAKFKEASTAYIAEYNRLMNELQRQLEPFKIAMDSVKPPHPDCIVIVDKTDDVGFSAYYPGSRKDYKAWLRIAHWSRSDEQEWQWLLDFDNIGNNSRTLNVLGKKGTYSVLKSQYPEMRKQAIDMLLAAGWKVLES